MDCFGWGQKHIADEVSTEILSMDNWLVLVNFKVYLGLDLVTYRTILISSTPTCSFCCCQVVMYIRTTTQWQWWKTPESPKQSVVLEPEAEKSLAVVMWLYCIQKQGSTSVLHQALYTSLLAHNAILSCRWAPLAIEWTPNDSAF